MPAFRLENGNTGLAKAWHTSTGYEANITHPWSSHKNEESSKLLFIRHVVNADGLPYVEAGISGLDDHEKHDAVSDLKRCLNNAGYAEVKSLAHASEGIKAFIVQDVNCYNAVSVRLKTGHEKGITAAANALGSLIHEDAVRFILEQEAIPDVLFQSILGVMGAEMEKGPGGHDHAVMVAQRLAAEFQRGTRGAQANTA